MPRRRAARTRPAPRRRAGPASPWASLRARRLDAIAGLIDPGTLVLIQELAAQQSARVLRHAPQPLLGRLLRRPFLHVLRPRLTVGGLVGRLLAGVRVLLIVVALRLAFVGLARLIVGAFVG